MNASGAPRQLFRLCKERFSASALTGEGARRYPGRWNEAGVPVVYCATSPALAALEFFVHLDPSVAPDNLVMVQLEMSEDVKVERITRESLPANWRLPDSSCAEIGSAWARSGRSVGLEVPSIVVDGDWNMLLNPLHPDFAKVKIVAQEPWHYDARMFR